MSHGGAGPAPLRGADAAAVPFTKTGRMRIVTDAHGPAVVPTARRGGFHRAGRWCTAALMAGAVLALSAGPAPARDSSALTDYPQTPAPVIAPGTSGQVVIGLKNTSPTEDVIHDGVPTYGDTGKMYLSMYADTMHGMTFADNTLTPVGGAPGPWSCTLNSDRTGLNCVSDYIGVLVPAGGTAQWQVNITVPPSAPKDSTLIAGPILLTYHYNCVVSYVTEPFRVR